MLRPIQYLSFGDLCLLLSVHALSGFQQSDLGLSGFFLRLAIGHGGVAQPDVNANYNHTLTDERRDHVRS